MAHAGTAPGDTRRRDQRVSLDRVSELPKPAGQGSRDIWEQYRLLERAWGGEPLGAKSWPIQPDPDILEMQYWAQSLVELFSADLDQCMDRLTELLAVRAPQ